MFITPVSMPCTEEQYNEFLKEPLEKMGYIFKDKMSWYLDCCKYITSNFNGNIGDVGNIVEEGTYWHNRYFISEFNPDLFLALCAMTDNPEGIPGEYWKIMEGCVNCFTKNKIYKQVDKLTELCPFIDDEGEENGYLCNYGHFVKATKEEIINHFKPTKMKEIEELKSQINQLSETIKIIEAQVKETQKEEDKNAFIKKFNTENISEISEKLFGDATLQILEGCTPEDNPELYGRAFYITKDCDVKIGKAKDGTYISIYKK